MWSFDHGSFGHHYDLHQGEREDSAYEAFQSCRVGLFPEGPCAQIEGIYQPLYLQFLTWNPKHLVFGCLGPAEVAFANKV